MRDPSSADAPAPTPGRLRVAECELDFTRGVLSDRHGKAVTVRPQVWAVLQCLGRNANRLVSKEELLAAVWPGLVVGDGSITQAISDARAALGERGHDVIRTLPRRGYMLVVDAPAAMLPASLGTSPSAAEQPINPLSVAVLAFSDIDPGTTGAGLARGIALDLLYELARNVNLRVVSHHSSFVFAGTDTALAEIGRQLKCRYLVDGQVRRDGDCARIGVELIDSTTGKIVWAEEHRVAVDELAALQDRLIQRIAGSMHFSVTELARRIVPARPPKSLDVYELWARGNTLWLRFEAQSMREGRKLLEHALAIDPEFSVAWSSLATLNYLDERLRISGDWVPDRVRQCSTQARRAAQLDPTNHLAFRVLSWVAGLSHDYDTALTLAERACELAPSSGDMLFTLATAQLALGQSEAAMRSAEAGMDLVPMPPGWLLQPHAFVLWAGGRTREALCAADECVAKLPQYWWARATRTYALVELGRLDEARQEAARLLERAPWFTANETPLVRPIGDGAPALRARMIEASIAAGIPSG